MTTDRSTLRAAGDMLARGSRPLLEVDDARIALKTSRGPLRAVDGVSFDVWPGETLGIVGESGSGKSVLVRAVMDILDHESIASRSGRVMFDGVDFWQLPAAERRMRWGAEIAMVFQDPMTSLNPVKKIGRQLLGPMRVHAQLSRAAAADRALELLREVGIPDPRRRFEQYPHELSGGMRQRVMIAIALSCSPRLLIADEPTTALDVTVQRQILELLAGLQQDHGMAMILISHDLGVVSGMADAVAVMYAGQFVEKAPTRELFTIVEHPYTAALLDSTPRVDRPRHARLEAIAGRPPDMVHPPEACRFAARCAHVQPICREQMPDVRRTELREHRCWFPLDRAALAQAEAS